jgi:hypothetical protein
MNFFKKERDGQRGSELDELVPACCDGPGAERDRPRRACWKEVGRGGPSSAKSEKKISYSDQNPYRTLLF